MFTNPTDCTVTPSRRDRLSTLLSDCPPEWVVVRVAVQQRIDLRFFSDVTGTSTSSVSCDERQRSVPNNLGEVHSIAKPISVERCPV